MKLIKSLLITFTIIFVGVTTSCGNNNDNNPQIYQLQTPTNFRVVEYEDGAVLFFDGDINAKEFRVTFFKDNVFFKRTFINQTQLLLGIYLDDLEDGKYSVKVIACADDTTTDLDSLESSGFEFVIGENIIPDDPNKVGLTNLSNYYKAAENLVGNSLKLKLRTIISSNVKSTSYSDLRTYLPLTDVDPENNNNIILFYGHVSVNNASSNWNREHVWPKSLGWFKESGAGSDVHHLRPENEGVNSARGNMRMGEVKNGKVCKYPDGTIAGHYANNYFEPNDCSKGDVARIFFYMLIRYSETDSNYPITRTAQSLELMLEWHLLDPVDDLERVRNERAYQYQGNRNPFIDYPEFAEVLWG